MTIVSTKNTLKLNLFEFDKNQKDINNTDFIIGTDEAGRGPGAGPVYAAAVCFKNNQDLPENLIQKLNDSKKLTPKTRKMLYDLIKNHSHFSIKRVEVEEIEKLNILQASLYAMKLAIDEIIKKLKTNNPNNSNNSNIIALIDGNKEIKSADFRQKAIIKGDATSASIAAASILAKVERDNYMEELDKIYPQYDFKNNKGYLTKTHIEAIKKYGLTPFHRPSFLKNILGVPEQLSLI